MKERKMRHCKTIILVLLLAGTVNSSLLAEENKPEERFTGDVIQSSGISKLTMVINHWTTSVEMGQFFTVRSAKGVEEMRKNIRQQKAGYIWFDNKSRIPINIASSQKTDKERTILLIVEHPLYAAEVYASADPTDKSRFSVDANTSPDTASEYYGGIFFKLNKKNKGKGRVFGKVKLDVGQGGRLKLNTREAPPRMLKRVKQAK